MKKLLAVVLAVGLCFTAWPGIGCAAGNDSAGEKNLLVNGDFQKTDRGGTPAGWKAMGNSSSRAEGSSMDITVDSENPFAEGISAVKVTNFYPADAKGRFFFGCEPFPIEPGKTYRFSIWLRSDAPLSVTLAIDAGSNDLARKLGKDYPLVDQAGTNRQSFGTVAGILRHRADSGPGRCRLPR